PSMNRGRSEVTARFAGASNVPGLPIIRERWLNWRSRQALPIPSTKKRSPRDRPEGSVAESYNYSDAVAGLMRQIRVDGRVRGHTANDLPIYFARHVGRNRRAENMVGSGVGPHREVVRVRSQITVQRFR